MQNDLWMVQVPGSGVVGMNTDELRSALHEGRLGLNTYVAPPGDPRWLKVTEADLGESVTRAHHRVETDMVACADPHLAHHYSSPPAVPAENRRQTPTVTNRRHGASVPRTSLLGYAAITLFFIGLGTVGAAVIRTRAASAAPPADVFEPAPIAVPIRVPMVAMQAPPAADVTPITSASSSAPPAKEKDAVASAKPSKKAKRHKHKSHAPVERD